MKRAFKWVCYSLALVILPWLPTILAGLIATALGCTLNEASVSPCYVFGADIGTLLYSMGVFGWIAIFISLIFFLFFIGCLIWLLKELLFSRAK